MVVMANNNKCPKINFTWENKGIVLGIIYYILKRYNKLENQRVGLDNKKLRILLSSLFTRIDFTKKGVGFTINVKNSKREGLVINNLNNLSDVRTKKIYLLPWYDKDNPTVMYFHRPEQVYDLGKFVNDTKKFSRCDRTKSYIRQNFVNSCYGLNIWDTDVEFSILDAYVRKFRNFDVATLYKLISDYLASDMCYAKVERQIVHVPVQVPVEVRVEVPVKVPVVKEKEKVNMLEDIKKKILDVDNDKQKGESNGNIDKENYKQCISIIEKVANKIEKTNDLLDIINK